MVVAEELIIIRPEAEEQVMVVLVEAVLILTVQDQETHLPQLQHKELMEEINLVLLIRYIIVDKAVVELQLKVQQVDQVELVLVELEQQVQLMEHQQQELVAVVEVDQLMDHQLQEELEVQEVVEQDLLKVAVLEQLELLTLAVAAVAVGIHKQMVLLEDQV